MLFITVQIIQISGESYSYIYDDFYMACVTSSSLSPDKIIISFEIYTLFFL